MKPSFQSTPLNEEMLKQLKETKLPRIAFNFMHMRYYKYKFLDPSMHHLMQVCVFEHFLMLSFIFIRNHRKAWFYNTHAQLTNNLGISTRTVCKVVDIMEEKGMLVKYNATSTSKTYFKLNYNELMKFYMQILDPDLFDDPANHKILYTNVLKHFAFMHKVSKTLTNVPDDEFGISITPVKKLGKKKRFQVNMADKYKAEFYYDEIDDE